MCRVCWGVGFVDLRYAGVSIYGAFVCLGFICKMLNILNILQVIEKWSYYIIKSLLHYKSIFKYEFRGIPLHIHSRYYINIDVFINHISVYGPYFNIKVVPNIAPLSMVVSHIWGFNVKIVSNRPRDIMCIYNVNTRSYG